MLGLAGSVCLAAAVCVWAAAVAARGQDDRAGGQDDCLSLHNTTQQQKCVVFVREHAASGGAHGMHSYESLLGEVHSLRCRHTWHTELCQLVNLPVCQLAPALPFHHARPSHQLHQALLCLLLGPSHTLHSQHHHLQGSHTIPL